MTSAGRSSIGWIPGLLGCALLACSSAHEQVGQTDQAITYGEPTEDDPAVVGLVYPVETKHVIGCTGSLVTPQWVLTAAHCVSPLGPDAIVIGESLNEGVTIGVGHWTIHPDFEAKSLRDDLALLKLDESAATEPLDIRRAREIEAQEPGALLRIVGFGRTEAAAPPRKRTGQARVANVSADVFGVEPAPSLSCSGDSGGPAFASIGGEEVVVGIASKGDWDCERSATYTHAASAADFLDRELALDSEQSAAACSAREPTPTSNVHAFWIGAALVSFFWRRSL